MTAAVVAVILIAALAAPALGRTTLDQAQSGTEGASALTLQDETNVTTTTTTPAGGANETPEATPTATPGQGGASGGDGFKPPGTPAAVPGRIEAENYDTGGQGVAWFDRTPGNQGGAYRQDDVDIETGGSGFAVAYVKSSEWLTYAVDVAEAGTYTATFRASSPWDDREVWVWVDGVLKAQVKVPNTGSFDTYEDATAKITLSAGSHDIRLQFYRDAQNLDYVVFGTGTGTGGGGQNVTPTATVTVTPTATVNVTPTSGQGGSNVTANATYTQAEADLQLEWRKLWEDHIFWTRMVIINIADTPGGTNESLDRLFQNKQDMQDAMQVYYGETRAAEFGELVNDHLVIAAVLVAAVKANNTTAAADLQAEWYRNGDQIAANLSMLNPNWNETEARAMWREHLNVTLNEAAMRLGKNWTGDIEAYDEVHRVGLEMADMFSTGILEQFPERFPGTKTVTREELDLQNGMRKLWTDHAEYTRLYLIAALDDAPGTDAVAARLLQNQVDLGDAIKPLYGDAAGTQLTALLRQHILIAVDIVNAVKANNSTAQAAAEANWTANADEIAVFLAGANPNWPEPVLKDLLYKHLSTTRDELVARVTRDYPADVKAWDVVYDHVLMMSDALAKGIIAQFPGKFGR